MVCAAKLKAPRNQCKIYFAFQLFSTFGYAFILFFFSIALDFLPTCEAKYLSSPLSEPTVDFLFFYFGTKQYCLVTEAQGMNNLPKLLRSYTIL